MTCSPNAVHCSQLLHGSGQRRKWAVFATVLLAALIATLVNIAALKAYFKWNFRTSTCPDKVMANFGMDRAVEWQLRQMATELNARRQDFDSWAVSHRTEGRELFFEFRAKRPTADMDAFRRSVDKL
jgi:hypothetical protein